MTRTALSIAGFDPSSGAGISADLAVFAAHGLNGTSAITALTVQSTTGVRSVHLVAAEVLRETLDCLEDDLPAAGMKIGMLGNADAVLVIAEHLERIAERRPKPIVVLDPVLVSSSGRELLDATGFRMLQDRLLPLVDWVTPNIPELALLSGVTVSRRDELPAAARILQSTARTRQLGIFATGGHLEPPDDLLLAPGDAEVWLPGKRVHTRATHGTGCALSSSFLCGLLMGLAAAKAARQAKEYVAGAMEHAVETGSGPCAMNHFWRLGHP